MKLYACRMVGSLIRGESESGSGLSVYTSELIWLVRDCSKECVPSTREDYPAIGVWFMGCWVGKHHHPLESWTAHCLLYGLYLAVTCFPTTEEEGVITHPLTPETHLLSSKD